MTQTVVICAVVAAIASLFAVPLSSDPVEAVKPRPIARGVLVLAFAVAFGRIAWEVWS